MTTPLRQNIRYSDIPINLQVHPIKGDLLTITNADAIKRSIKNLLLTDRGERFFKPFLGAGLKTYLFENISSDIAYLIKEEVTLTIQNYEKRANVIRVNVVANPDYNSYSVSVIFSIINNPEPITLDLILERIR